MTNDKLKIEYSYSRVLGIGLFVSLPLVIILKNHLEFYLYVIGLILLLFFYFDSKDLIIEKDKLTYIYYLRAIPFLRPKTVTFSSQDIKININYISKSGWGLTITKTEKENKRWKKIVFTNRYSMGKIDWDINVDTLVVKLKEFGFSVDKISN